MKKSTDDLFLLIKSLTKSEKGYFRKYSNKYSSKQNAYLKIFDAIEKQTRNQDEYNEEAIKKYFIKENFSKQFSVAKDYLYKLILKSLTQSYSGNPVKSNLLDMMNSIEVLYNRCFFEQTSKLIKKSKSLAYDTENFLILYELLQWEKNILQETVGDEIIIKCDEIYQEEKACIELFAESSKIKNIYTKVTSIILTNGFLREKKDILLMKKLVSDPIMKDINILKSFQAKTFYHDILGVYYSSNRDFKNYYSNILQNIKLYEDNPDKIKKHSLDYVITLFNTLSGALYLYKLNDFKQISKKFRNAPQKYKLKSNAYVEQMFIYAYKFDLMYFNILGEYDEGLKFLKQVQHKIDASYPGIDMREIYFIYYQISLLCFGNENYSEANKWLNKILNNKEPEQRKEIYLAAKLLNLIIHYELQNFEYLDYLVKSTYHYLRRKKNKFKFEKLIIQFITEIPKKINQKELLELFNEYKFKLSKIKQDPFEEIGLSSFDYISWLESKINGKKYSDIIKEKALTIQNN